MIKALFKHIYKYYKDTFILAIAGVVIGVLVGIIDAAFGLGLNACTTIRTKYFWYLIWFLPLGGVFIWFIYHQFGKSVANGMKMVFHVGLGKNTKLPIRMVPLCRHRNLDNTPVWRKCRTRRCCCSDWCGCFQQRWSSGR